MAIKVKHEGNATAAAFASAQGGLGKRRQQDAASMASVMQQAANSGNQQLHGATGSSSAPGKSSASTIHAPLGSAPTPTVLPRGTYGGLRGGFGSGTGFGFGTGLGGATAGGASRAASGVGAKSAYGGGSRSDGSFFVNAAKADLIDAQRRQIENEERRKLQDSLFVESDNVFGKHSVDAYWDGSHWVRPYRPGEKEAESQYRQLLVKDQFAGIEAERNASFNDALYRNRMSYDSEGYRQKVLTDLAAQGTIGMLEQQKNKVLDVARAEALRRSRGVVRDESSNISPTDEQMWGLPATQEASQTQNADVSNSFDYESIRRSGGRYYGSGGSVNNETNGLSNADETDTGTSADETDIGTSAEEIYK